MLSKPIDQSLTIPGAIKALGSTSKTLQEAAATTLGRLLNLGLQGGAFAPFQAATFASGLLPNDLLRNPPWPQTIMTWPINEAFLQLTQVSDETLRELGYYLKFGIEVNLDVLSPAEARKVLNVRHSPVRSHWRRACCEQFLHDLQIADLPAAFPAFAAQVHAQLENIAKQHQQRNGPDSKEWLANWQLTQSFYRHASASKATSKTLLAQKDFMIAALHLLPQHLGGLNGLIEQRFASAHYGYGWWDGKNSVELRTKPIRGYESTISNYHEVLWRLKKAVEAFGFVPISEHALAQTHFSLWRIKDDMNIMADDSDSSLSIRTTLANVLYDMFDRLPVGHFSPILDMNPIEAAPFVGSSRVSTIRTCTDNWELRLPHPGGVTHLARDLSYIAWAAFTALKPDHHPSQETENKEKAREFLMGQLLGESSLPKRPIKRMKRLSIAADPPRIACPFISCLEAAVLGENNELLVPRDTFVFNRLLLSNAVGAYGIDLFSVEQAGTIYNLEVVEGWQELFKTIRVAGDQQLDISSLHPELAIHFQGLTIKSIRTDIHMPEANVHVPFEQRHYSDLVKAHYLAEGIGIIFGGELQEAQKEIFGFVRDRNLSFDAEEAIMYLGTLYSTFRNDLRSARLPEAIVTRAASRFILSSIKDLLVDAIRYRTAMLERLSPFFEDYDILKTMLAYRENIIGSLPDVAQLDPPHSARFFDKLGGILSDPVKLYSFDHMVETLQRVSQATSDIIVNFAKYDERMGLPRAM